MSTAISAQGSTLQVATTGGSAKTISAVAVGNPTILTTSTAHGFALGDPEAIAGLTGADAALLNATTQTAQFVTTNTFAVPVDTTGKTITPGSGTATPTNWAKVGNFKTYTGFDGKAVQIDSTDLDSTAMEKIQGLVDFGSFQVGINWKNTDAGQAKMYALYNSSTTGTFKLTLPNGRVATFQANVESFPISGGTNQLVQSTVTLDITGPVVWS